MLRQPFTSLQSRSMLLVIFAGQGLERFDFTMGMLILLS